MRSFLEDVLGLPDYSRRRDSGNQFTGSDPYSGGGVPVPQPQAPNVISAPMPMFGEMFRKPLRGAMSLLDRLGGDSMFDTGVGLLAASGPSFLPTNFGQAFAGAQDYATHRESERMRQEAMRREFEEVERQRQASAGLVEMIRSMSNPSGGRPPLNPTQAGLISSTAQVDPLSAIGLLAETGMFSPPSQPGLSETGEKLRDVSDVLGRELTEQEALVLAGGGQLFEADEEKPDEPLSANELLRIRQEDGSQFPFGTTAAEAQAAGARVYSEAELDQQRTIATALNTLDTIESMALGDNGVFVDNGGSPLTNNVLGRLANGVANGLGWLAGTEASVRRQVFSDTSAGAISSLVRSLGESGALATADVERALALIPQLGAIPATEREARSKFTELRTIIQRGVDSAGSPTGGGGPEYNFDPLTGRLSPKR